MAPEYAVDILETQLSQSELPDAPAKWIDLISETVADCSALRLEFARGNRGSFMARGEPITTCVRYAEAIGKPSQLIIEAESEGVREDYNPSTLAAEIYANAWMIWQTEKATSPELQFLRCKLVAIGKQNEILCEETIRLQPRKHGEIAGPKDMFVSEADLGGDDSAGLSPAGGGMSSREHYHLRHHNAFLLKTVEHLIGANLNMVEKTGMVMNNALGMVQTHAAGIVNQIRAERKEVEELRRAGVSDARWDSTMMMARDAFMMWIQTQQAGKPNPAPNFGDDPNPTTTSDRDTERIELFSRLQTLAKDLQDAIGAGAWDALASMDPIVAADLKTVLAMWDTSEEELRAALSAVMPAVQPHALELSKHLDAKTIGIIGLIIEELR